MGRLVSDAARGSRASPIRRRPCLPHQAGHDLELGGGDGWTPGPIAPEGEGGDMALDPSLLVHAEDGSSAHVAAVREDHGERLYRSPLPSERVDPHAQQPVVHLRLLSRWRIGPTHRDVDALDELR